ncbi:MAG: hypothetical protein GY696_23385, partial [Gammaproteobacteria bacterium]|nr:hypothetical protein [Gammaproteobacteria bacterium]
MHLRKNHQTIPAAPSAQPHSALRSIWKNCVLLACLALLVVPTLGARGCGSDGSSFSEAQTTALQNALDQAIDDAGIPGGAAAVKDVGGGAVWMGATGTAAFSPTTAGGLNRYEHQGLASFFT